ncbi:7-carboxy-7-deazaguanine synthase QueE [bacterium]|nr:7-carboxy-7-deazaguanine synthase QueE [Candidatus Neomarinimicrobiota bacterium]MCK5685465.1 7-carboxy-7-deazaguanine synthase QueE [bacterium]
MGNQKQQSHLYSVNDIFYSIQGEGYWTGTAAIFVRFAHCNLSCSFCDTEFESFTNMSLDKILKKIKEYPSKHLVLTGGEPLMRDISFLCDVFKKNNYFIQVETNGMYAIGDASIDWISMSPKNDKIVLKNVQELKVLLKENEKIPDYSHIEAEHYYLSPLNLGHDRKTGTFESHEFDYKSADWCYRQVLKYPHWKMSVQLHKLIGVK